MFAVIKTGGKQYKVTTNDVIKVEKLDGDIGSVVVFDEVFAIGDEKKITLGDPVVKGVKVSAEVLEQKKDDKVIVFKKKRRHNYRRKHGHRQQISVLRIQDIGENVSAKKPETKAKPVVKEKNEVAEKPSDDKTETKK